MKKKPTSLVTGSAGFIGSHVARELVSLGHRVVGLDDLSGGFVENQPRALEFHRGSIADAPLVDALFEKYRFDNVFHLAAYAAEGLSHFIRRFNYVNNLLGSATLINAAVNSGTVKTFVFTSSMAVYGTNQVPMREELEPHPEDPYGIAKYAVELDLKAAHDVFGLDYVIFRPHNVYGEKQNLSDGHRNVIGIFMNQIMRGESLTIFGDGEQRRAFSYIEDVAPIIARSIDRPAAKNRIFNLGNDRPSTVNEVAAAVSAVFGKPLSVKNLPPRVEVRDAFCAHDDAREVFGDLLKNVPLEEGLARMGRWASRLGPKERRYFGGVEIEKKLPAQWAKAIARPTFTQIEEPLAWSHP